MAAIQTYTKVYLAGVMAYTGGGGCLSVDGGGRNTMSDVSLYSWTEL